MAILFDKGMRPLPLSDDCGPHCIESGVGGEGLLTGFASRSRLQSCPSMSIDVDCQLGRAGEVNTKFIATQVCLQRVVSIFMSNVQSLFLRWFVFGASDFPIWSE